MISVSYFQLQIQLFYLVTCIVQARLVQILQKRCLKSVHIQQNGIRFKTLSQLDYGLCCSMSQKVLNPLLERQKRYKHEKCLSIILQNYLESSYKVKHVCFHLFSSLEILWFEEESEDADKWFKQLLQLFLQSFNCSVVAAVIWVLLSLLRKGTLPALCKNKMTFSSLAGWC